MHVAEKIYSLAQYVTTADIRAMAPHQRRLLAAQLKRLLAIAEKVESEAPKAGVLSQLSDGGRDQ